MYIVKDSISQQIPVYGRQDLPLLRNNRLIGIGVPGGGIETRGARVLHLMELCRYHQTGDGYQLKVVVGDIRLKGGVEIHHQNTVMNSR